MRIKEFIGIFCMLALTAAALAQTPADVAKALATKLAAAQSLTANMSVTFPGSQTQTWKIELLKPNLYKVIAPDQQFRSDGKVESVYLVVSKHYQYTDRKGAQITDAPFALGLNFFFPGNVPPAPLGGGATTLDGKRAYGLNIQEPGFSGPTVLYVDPATSLPLGYEEPVGQGSMVKVRYSELNLNPALEPGGFAWTPPATATPIVTPDLAGKLLKEGITAPILEVTDLNGADKDLAPIFAGNRSTLLYFWKGSPPIADLASLEQMYTELSNQRFQIVIVDSNVTADAARKQLQGVTIPFTVVVDRVGSLAKAYGVETTSEFIVGTDGKIGARFLGYDPDGIAKALRQRGFRI